MMKDMAIAWVLSRAKEASTWAGMAVALQNAIHVNFNADFVNSWVSVGMAIAGLAAVVVKEGATAPVAAKK